MQTSVQNCTASPLKPDPILQTASETKVDISVQEKDYIAITAGLVTYGNLFHDLQH